MNKRKLNLKPYENYLIGNINAVNTRDAYILAVRQLLERVNKGFKEDITKEDLENFKLYAIQIKKWSTNSLTPKFNGVNSYLVYIGKDEDWLKKYKLKPPQSITPNKVPLSVEDIQSLFKTSSNDIRNNAILKTLYYSAIRRSELIGLNLEDIDYERQKLRIGSNTFNPKRNKHQEINIHPDCLEAIKKYLTIRSPKNPEDRALFLNIYGGRIGKSDVNLTIKRCGMKANIKKRIYPHLFRITAITHMYKRGCNIQEIKHQSRHSDVKTLLGYVQLSDQEVKDSYMKGMTLDNNTPIINNTNNDNKADIDKLEIILTQKLALGQITSEAYIQAIQHIKNKDVFKGYQ
jgi:site-specific recombinase XerD